MPRIVVTQRVLPETSTRLKALQADVVINESAEPWPNEVLLHHARDADALLVFMPDSLDGTALRQCPRLQVIAGALKGGDNFDLAACKELGIRFTLVPDLLSEPTAELALSLMLGLARHILPGDDRIRSGTYQGWRPELYGLTVIGAKVGLIGYGAVARALTQLLSGFRARILWSDPEMPGVSLDQLLAASDFVLPLVPLTAATVRLINANTIARMRPGTLLVNVGRGSVVDEWAIAEALAAGHLGGYAADVFAMEDWLQLDRPREIPPPLLAERSKTLFTPHLGSATRGARLAIEGAALDSILDHLAIA